MRADLKTLSILINKLFYILNSKQKRTSFIVFFSMLLSSALEMLGVSLIYPILDLMVNQELLDEKWYINLALSLNPNADFKDALVFFCLIIIVVYLIKNVVVLLCSYIQISFSARFKRELSTLMLTSYLKRPYEFFVNNNSAEILRGINGDAMHTYQILSDIFDFLSAFVTALLIGLFLISTDWIVALGALLLAACCFIVLVFGFKRKMKRAGKVFIEATTKQYKYSYQAVNAIKEITVMDRRDCFVKQYEDAALEYEKASVTNSFISACPDRFLEGICVGGFIGISCIRFIIGGDLNTFIPVMGTFAMGAFKILPSISKMSNRINSIVYQQPSLYNCYDNILEARRYETEEQNHSLKANNNSEQYVDLKDKIDFRNTIQINNLSWKYANSEKIILNGLNLSIHKGESVALIGSSGAGKSTLADIILGLYHPKEGCVLVDEIDISRIPHSWAKTVGYVPQMVFLLDDTIKANIAFGLPLEIINETTIWKALEQAQLAEFVRSLPEGIDTIVGERGIKFSGGQRQRIAIARALYDDPEVLIFDEATSALDAETEAAVMESIDALQGQKTIIIIAHRLSTIKNCDRVYEIKEGMAVERNKDDVIANKIEK